MKDLTITAKYHAGKEDEKTGSITVKAPENLKEAQEMFGGDAVLTNAIANWVVGLQGNIRSGLGKGEDAKALQIRLGGSKMGVAATKAAVDPQAAWLARYQLANPAERKAMKADLLKQAESMD